MSCTFPFHCIATTLLLALSVQEAPLPHQPLRLGCSDANAQGNAVVAICVTLTGMSGWATSSGLALTLPPIEPTCIGVLSLSQS